MNKPTNNYQLPTTKIAIVHDWLYGGGAERVVEELHHMFPDAPIYTSYCSEEWRKKLDGKVVTGFLQHWPFSKLRKFLAVFRIWWFTHLDFSSYDLVISSSGNGEAFGIKTPKNTVHINYCHTPTHYYWRHYDKYLKDPGFGMFSPLARLGLRLLVGPLRRWDYKAAQRADYIIANSTHIQKDIKKYYRRESVVIHPPVGDDVFEHIKTSARDGFITSGRQVPQKHIELAVLACTTLRRKLIVAGDGPENKKLRALAGPTVSFVGWVPDEQLKALLAAAEAYIFPALDDFGLAPVAAMAAGTPVIAYRGGGALDYVEEGKTGLFFDKQTVASLIKSLRAFDTKEFKHHNIRSRAEQFSPIVFRQKFEDLINQKVS